MTVSVKIPPDCNEPNFTLIGEKEKTIKDEESNSIKRRKSGKRTCICCAILTGTTGIFTVCVLLAIYFMDSLKPLRCDIAQKLSFGLSQCTSQGVLRKWFVFDILSKYLNNFVLDLLKISQLYSEMVNWLFAAQL